MTTSAQREALQDNSVAFEQFGAVKLLALTLDL